MGFNDSSTCYVEPALAASRYMELRNYDNYQRNGQRVSTNRALEANNNCDGEVFVGAIPRDLFEDELLPMMERAGRVVKMRLMMDFSGSNRGFAFVEYFTKEEAINACKILNNKEIREGEDPIGVTMSFNNRKLTLGNLPIKISREKLRSQLDMVIQGVESIQIQRPSFKMDCRFALVTFKTHEAATQARRILCPGDIRICNRIVSIEWAKPELPRDLSTSTTSSAPSPVKPSNQLVYSAQCPSIAPIGAPKAVFPARNNGLSPIQAPCRAKALTPVRAANLPKTSSPAFAAPTFAGPFQGILGEKARQMLAACPPDPQCTTIIDNIDLNVMDETRLRAVLQLLNFLTVTRMVACGPTTLEVTYETADEAKLMTSLLNRFPEQLDRLTVAGRQLKARQISMPDSNANYQLSMPHPDQGLSEILF